MTEKEHPITTHREYLLGLAYRMLGSVVDAEDVLQDAYIRYAAADRCEVKSNKGFLVTMITRLCLDRLKSARARREIYVGPWLPEPVVDANALSPEATVELADDLSFALMLTLDRLSAAERAAFLLHDVFETPFNEVAVTLGRSEAACRQLAARARKAVSKDRPEENASHSEHQRLLASFLGACGSGDVTQLSAFLCEDVITYTDGGGIKTSALNPIFGAAKSARFFLGLFRKSMERGTQLELKNVILNGVPAYVFYLDGELDQTLSLDIHEGKISRIYIVRNPEKLTGISEKLNVH